GVARRISWTSSGVSARFSVARSNQCPRGGGLPSGSASAKSQERYEFMKLGLAGINVGTLAVPEFGRLATLAEELGYDSLWTAEHIGLPDLPPGETPRPGTMPFLDSIAALGFLAAHTRTMKLATGVLLLPQHNPLLLAKQLASVDVLSGGRLIVGIGVGAVEREAQAMGSPMHERGSRANDYLKAMIALWTMPHPKYAGRHVSFDGINAYP